MPDPTDKRIEELWQYIPPYTAPNHPPQVKVITTTNTGDTPMTEEDPDLLAGDNLDGLRGRNPYSPMSERFRLTELLETAKYQNNLLVQKCRELEKERDEARLRTGRIFNEIDCRIEHGADSNGHLEAIRNMFEENTNCTDRINAERNSAADEIELLRKRLREIRDGFEGCCAACEPVGEMNKRLREERDEARRLYCEEQAFTIELERGEAGHPPDLAAEKGWDCYDRSLQRKKSDAALDELARLDEELGLIPPPTDHGFLQDRG